jgi:hypothetical protein
MREMADPNGVYRKWHPPQQHAEEIKDFLSGLTKVIKYSHLEAFSSIVRIDDLARFNSEMGLKIEAYPLAVYGCMIVLSLEHDWPAIELVFDHVEQVDSKLCKARALADSDSYYGGAFDHIINIPLQKALTFRNVIGLQAADFSVWELRKNHLQLGEWFGLEGKPSKFEDRVGHFEEWSRRRFGQSRPTMRKSLEALLQSGPMTTLVWDYDQLREAHRLRNGVWSLSAEQSS